MLHAKNRQADLALTDEKIAEFKRRVAARLNDVDELEGLAAKALADEVVIYLRSTFFAESASRDDQGD
jgi:hypothetical protein